MGKYISPNLYNKYKQRVLDMSITLQLFEGQMESKESRSLSDREIAERLGLSVVEVSEIGTIARNDLLPANAWIEAEEEKRRKCLRYFNKRRKPQ